MNTEFNYDLLEEILTRVEQSPELFDMRYFKHDTACGTTYCVAGWACVLRFHDINYITAKVLLGIEHNAGDKLFYEFNNEQALKVIRAILRAKGRLSHEYVIETLYRKFIAAGEISPFDTGYGDNDDDANNLSLSQ